MSIKSNLRIILFLFVNIIVSNVVLSQKTIPADKVLNVKYLGGYLNADIRKEISVNNKITDEQLAEYFRQKFAERFFYDWHTFPERFDLYNSLYDNKAGHIVRANDHINKFAAKTPWVLPFTYLNGEVVNAYAVRHLARQHKMVDIALLYFYENKNPKYLHYFVDQMSSLNTALKNGKYEKMEDGNGTYEAFRAGYRVLNWLNIHNMFLGQPEYTDNDQLVTIATLLQHGSSLYEENAQFQPGNHQTRGVSALAMIAILLRDFKGADLWYERAMLRLSEHMQKEINIDGFQFERSVHYHISDIENYFYVYQLAQISKMQVDKTWETKLKSLFETLVKISYPDKTAPVLQDDTDNPWAEKNDISGTMTLGYLLFKDSVFGYFAENKVESSIYWFLNKNQLDNLNDIAKKKPVYSSLYFPDTRYYVMRNGWDNKDNMMIISAGCDSIKPDHQHGDILGVQAMANGQVVLPNYQVNYPLPDFQFFKNSMVKNVAFVDIELQGKEWKGNQGGSGFGKFAKLPHPTTILWQSNADFDIFVGSHDGFENVGVKYTRQVIGLKNDFWIVKDNFSSNTAHEYKQVWQGHYSTENIQNLLRSVFPDAAGCDIYQLSSVDKVKQDGTRGKQWSVVSKMNKENYSFITVVFPYVGFGNRIIETDISPDLKNWKQNSLAFQALGTDLRSLSKDKEAFLFNVSTISYKGINIRFSKATDLYIQIEHDKISLLSIADKLVELTVEGGKLNKVEKIDFEKSTTLKPGDKVSCTAKLVEMKK